MTGDASAERSPYAPEEKREMESTMKSIYDGKEEKPTYQRGDGGLLMDHGHGLRTAVRI